MDLRALHGSFDRRWRRVALSAGLAAALGTLAVPAAVAGKTACCYYYVGTISQHGHTRFFDLDLQRNSSGTGWQVRSRWRPNFSPTKCANAWLFTPQTALTAVNVHLMTVIPKVKTKLVIKNGNGQNNRFINKHKVKNFTAVFTKGKVSGSFSNDTFVFNGTRCSTGPITFTATRSAF